MAYSDKEIIGISSSNAKNLISQFNKLADQAKKQKEWESRHEIAGVAKSQSLRNQLREVLFSPQRATSFVKERKQITERKLSEDVDDNNNNTTNNISITTKSGPRRPRHFKGLVLQQHPDDPPVRPLGNITTSPPSVRGEDNKINANTMTNNKGENTNVYNNSPTTPTTPTTPTDRLSTASNRAERRAKRAQRSVRTVNSEVTSEIVESNSEIVIESTKGIIIESTKGITIESTKRVTDDVSPKAVDTNIESTNKGLVVKIPSPTSNKNILERTTSEVLQVTPVSTKNTLEVKNASTSVRDRINTWARESSNDTSKPEFGVRVDYTRKTSPPTKSASLPRSFTGSTPPNKYTATVNRPQRFYSTGFVTSSKLNENSNGRPQGTEKDEPETPVFTTDTMTERSEAIQKTENDMNFEEKIKQIDERRILIEKKRKREEEKRKEEDLLKKKEEEEKKLKKEQEEEKKLLEAKAEEEMKNAVPDSEKMKHVAPCQKKRERKSSRRTMSISNIVLDWVQEMTKDYPVDIRNFSGSWNDGMAFCALIHHFNPHEFDFNELKAENTRYNFDLAFNTGMRVKNIPILLDTEDMIRMKKPEPRSVQTYVQWIWSVYGPTSGYGPTPQEIRDATIS